ncbi:hypothetical protein HHE02_15830 [Helicobacter heilmannii]|nr:hypothetical protein HHE014_06100 [Helicobacter heilmannii]CRF48261.1 hypothetical protein HHE02_15830 [Helicobacter heilmannii]CRF51711.1 hypothetical protein HHE06_16070 [Helicobacter heilmannii]
MLRPIGSLTTLELFKTLSLSPPKAKKSYTLFVLSLMRCVRAKTSKQICPKCTSSRFKEYENLLA